MRLPSSFLSERPRQIVRFTVVGVSGTLIQYGLYYACLRLMEWLLGAPLSEVLVTAAFTVGFCLEMITNYILSNYYIFGTRPNIANAGGFLAARGFNYLVQIAFLQLFLFVHMSQENAGIVAIVVAGVINYFVMHFVFNRLTKPKQ